MKTNCTKLFVAAACLMLVGCAGTPSQTASQATSATNAPVPHLEKRGNVTQLIVDGKPWLALAGELHNSSSSSAEYMKNHWSTLKATGLNTVLAVVSWEQVEPEEGKFDFTVVDDLLRDARTNHMRLVILWFGSWKNGISSYHPTWVKKDTKRFPLIQTKNGGSLNILSTMGDATREADKKAYAAMMRHLAETDKQHTVIMIQMENEVGLHGDTRDYRPEAVAKFNGAVPEALMKYMASNKDKLIPEFRAAWEKAGAKTSGTWEEVFGKGDYTDELFMAWQYASYMNDITAAGKAELPVPVFVNAWIVQPQDKHPGDYPSGGPQAQNHDVWRAAAPSIDMLCPDIYLPDFPSIIKMYSRAGNPVFIPESSAGIYGAANAVYAIGEMGAIGYSPFGIESRGYVSATTGVVSDEDAIREANPFAFAYQQLGAMAQTILEHQAAGSIRAAWLRNANPSIPETTFTLGDYKVKVELRKTRYSTTVPEVGYALVMQEAADTYLVMGNNVDVTFAPANGKGIAAPAKVQEGDYVNGTWKPERWLNGDEIQLRYDLLVALKEGQSGQGLRFRNGARLQKIWLYKYSDK